MIKQPSTPMGSKLATNCWEDRPEATLISNLAAYVHPLSNFNDRFSNRFYPVKKRAPNMLARIIQDLTQ